MLFKSKLNLYKFFREIGSSFIFDKSKKREFRQETKTRLEEMAKNLSNNYKWGVSYSVFDGEELLEKSILSIRDSVDYINVVYQTKSWYGKPANPDLLDTLNKLVEKGLIDELVEYVPNLKLDAGRNERKKRNLGLKYSIKAKCDYFMTMDVDEFYVKSELEEVKEEIVKNGITHAYCPIVNYGQEPTQRKQNIDDFAVQIFSKINGFSKLRKNKRKVAIVDPTRTLNHFFGAKYFFFLNVQMHHMSNIRKDLKKKFDNSSNSDLQKSGFQSLSNDENLYFEVSNQFNIERFE